jgi:RNA 3'-terminal phosphate cyclase (ATP)
MDLIEVDGSYGEGGGQILRSAIALSSIIGKGVLIKGIRKNRPRPGLAIQHIKSIELARDMTDARVTGLGIGSTELKFIPGRIKGGSYFLDVGTAGSITLVLQSVMPIANFASSPVLIDIIGGTDVKWSPPFDYLQNVTLPALKKFGFEAELSLIRRGFFPRGGGRVVMKITPSKLHSANITRPEGETVNGVSSSSRLPPHVVERQASAAKKILEQNGYSVGNICLDPRDDPSTGSSITLYKGLIGGNALGERGLPAEKVGEEAASLLIKEIMSGAAVDSYLADQLIPYMALSPGDSKVLTCEITSHATTNIWVVEKLTGKKFTVEKNKMILIRS